MCDFSPPRGADPALLEPARHLDADLLSVAYNPARSVRMDSLVVAHLVQREFGKTAVFNLSTRDMNRLALQSHLLGAQALGVHNVLVVRGDDFTAQERTMVTPVHDYRPTELIAAIGAMNGGTDFKGLKLRQPTAFCVGAAVDLGHPMAAEVALTRRKVEAGARFLVTQALYRAELVEQFHEAYRREAGGSLSLPVFYGLPILTKDGILFGDVPASLREELERGRSGVELALQQLDAFRGLGCRCFYLVPPILRGGIRDYQMAQEFLQQAHTG